MDSTEAAGWGLSRVLATGDRHGNGSGDACAAGGRGKGQERVATKRGEKGTWDVAGAGPSPAVRPQQTGRAHRVQTNRRAIQGESGSLAWALGSGMLGRRDRGVRGLN